MYRMSNETERETRARRIAELCGILHSSIVTDGLGAEICRMLGHGPESLYNKSALEQDE